MENNHATILAAAQFNYAVIDPMYASDVHNKTYIVQIVYIQKKIKLISEFLRQSEAYDDLFHRAAQVERKHMAQCLLEELQLANKLVTQKSS